jgi:hypothetical protein
MFTCTKLFFLLCLMKINLVFCSLCSISSFFLCILVNKKHFFLLSFHFYSSRSTHNNVVGYTFVSLAFSSPINGTHSQENSEFLHLNQNQLHQSSVNVGFSNIAYNPESSPRSGEVDEGTSTDKG